MIDELVKMLRVCGDSNNSCGNCPILEGGSCPHGEWEFAAEKYMLQAADAIEELQAAKCPYYIRNIHDRGDDSLCEKWRCEVKEIAPVRHGRWNVYSVKNCLYTCSECHCLPRDRTRYCPNCGAKMDKE